MAGAPEPEYGDTPEEQIFDLFAAIRRTLNHDQIVALDVLESAVSKGLQVRRDQALEAQMREEDAHRRAEDALRDEKTGFWRETAGLTRMEARRTVIVAEKHDAFYLFFDLNGMKDVNDRLTHHVGDRYLLCFADQLRAVFRDFDAMRDKGDEFEVLISGQGLTRALIRRRLSVLAKQFASPTVKKEFGMPGTFTVGVVDLCSRGTCREIKAARHAADHSNNLVKRFVAKLPDARVEKNRVVYAPSTLGIYEQRDELFDLVSGKAIPIDSLIGEKGSVASTGS